MSRCFFFFNDTATTEIYTLSLHDALPIWRGRLSNCRKATRFVFSRNTILPFSVTLSQSVVDQLETVVKDRKSTRLNSSHGYISYAVFCLKKKKNTDVAALQSITRIRSAQH